MSKISPASVKEASFLAPLIKRSFGGDDTPRRYDYVHASDLTNTDRVFCAREFCLAYKNGVIHRKEQSHSFVLRVTFDVGKMSADRICNQYLKDHAWGWWGCSYCHNEYRSFMKCPALCECGSVDFTYVEVEIFDKEFGVGGSVDIFVEVEFDDGWFIVPVELKIMGNDQFKSLAMPLAEHRVRTLFYMSLVQRHPKLFFGKVAYDRALILYWCRGFGSKSGYSGAISPFKEFAVNCKDPLYYVESYWGKAKRVRDYVMGDTTSLPDRIKPCSNPYTTRAQSCPFSASCFGEVG